MGERTASNLDGLLKDRNIHTIAVAGLLTNVCVESTVRAGYDAGYELLVIKDCTACRSKSWQDYAEQNIFPMFGSVIIHDELLNLISKLCHPSVLCQQNRGMLIPARPRFDFFRPVRSKYLSKKNI